MQKIIAWFVHNPVAANLLMIGIVLVGIIGYANIEREAFPLTSANTVMVSVVWPGAAPQELEEQVVIRLEQAFSDLDNIEHVRSTVNEGSASIRVEANSNVDMESFLSDVKLRVDSVISLPRDMEPPRVRLQNRRQEMMRLAVHGDLTERELTRLAQQLRDEVSQLDFISIVELFGARKEEVSIELSEQAMRRYGLTFNDVATAIRASSLNLSSGSIRTATGDVLLRARNLADNEQDFADIVIRQSKDGGILRISDVARVVDGYVDEEILATLNGENSVLVQVMTTDQMDVVKASESMHKWLEGAKKRMPEGVHLTLWWDSSEIYSNRMSTITRAALSGLLLVFLILILTLRPIVALWVTMGIGVAFIGTLSVLPVTGVSLNVISTFAFLLVLGIVVDDAIVVGESIHHHSSDHGGGAESAIAGTISVAKPVIFAVLTTIVAFLPWLFLSGETVQITRQLSIVISVALTISMIEAFFILPAHLRHLKHRKSVKGLARLQQIIEHSVVKFAHGSYRRILGSALRQRYLTAAIFISFFIISVSVFSSGWVKFSFMPEIESDQVYINVEMPSGSPYSRALEILRQLQRAEKQLVKEVDETSPDAQLIENWYTRSRRDSVLAIVKLAPPEVRELSAKETATRLRELVGDIPDAQSVTVEYTLNNATQRINYSVEHSDLDTLREAVNELETKLSSFENVFYVRNDLQGSADELHFSLLPGAQQLGVNLADVSNQVRQAYYGEEVQRLPRKSGDVKVMVRYPKNTRRNLDSLDEFRIRTADGRELPLLSVVSVEFAPGIKKISRRDGKRSAYIDAELSGDVRKEIMDQMEKDFIPGWLAKYPGLQLEKEGQAEGEAQFFREVMSLYAVALFIMYALIAIAFKSYWLPAIIMTAIPFGFMGAVYGHLIYNTPMALYSYFGIGAAAGVVVNDNLVLIDYIQQLRGRGMKLFDAVIEAGVQRFRPILLTSVTTFVGLAPMLTERSTQAQFLHPAVISLSFGVLFALFVTLLFVPAVYAISEDFVALKKSIKTLYSSAPQ
jgi:multidrug efflux pump subunit AcrB